MAEEISELERLREEVTENKNKLLRALADFDNYKKRAALEREQIIQFANEALITDLLSPLDGFSRAMLAVEKSKTEEEIVKGLALIKRQFEDSLKKHGVAEIASLGKPYDPQLHEAILQKADAGPEGSVIEEMQKGYTLHGRLIRPAMVIVSRRS